MQFSLNSIYFQISIYTWQHPSIQIHGQWIRKEVDTDTNQIQNNQLNTPDIEQTTKQTRHRTINCSNQIQNNQLNKPDTE